MVVRTGNEKKSATGYISMIIYECGYKEGLKT